MIANCNRSWIGPPVTEDSVGQALFVVTRVHSCGHKWHRYVFKVCAPAVVGSRVRQDREQVAKQLVRLAMPGPVT